MRQQVNCRTRDPLLLLSGCLITCQFDPAPERRRFDRFVHRFFGRGRRRAEMIGPY